MFQVRLTTNIDNYQRCLPKLHVIPRKGEMVIMKSSWHSALLAKRLPIELEVTNVKYSESSYGEDTDVIVELWFSKHQLDIAKACDINYLMIEL